MRKNFLLLLWLTLLPLAGWAQHLASEEDTYSGSSLPFPTVWYDAAETQQITASGFTSGNTQYRITSWTYEGSNVTQYKDAGEYTVIVQRRTRTGSYAPWGSWGTYRELTFTVNKADVTVALYQVVREWRAPWENPNVSTLESTAYTVTGADATWELVKSALTWNQLQAVENVGSYKYTMNAGEHKNYVIHVDAGAADLKVEKNTTGYWKTSATDGADLTYNGSEQSLEPTDVPEFMDTDDNIAGTIEYTLDPTDDTSWSTEFPKAQDADTYTITYRGVGDINHIDAATTGTYKVIIKKADVAIEIRNIADEIEFTDPAIALSPGFVAPGEDAVSDAYNAEVDPSTAVYTWTFNGSSISAYNGKAGDWEVTVTVPASTNFNESTAKKAFVVNKADAGEIALTAAEGLKFQYDQATNKAVKQDLITTGTSEGATLMYSLTGDAGSYSDVIPQGDHAGKYTVYYYAKGDANHNDNGAEGDGVSVEVEIAKVDFVLATTPTAATGLVFNAAEQSLLASGISRDKAKCPQGVVTYFIDGDDTNPIDGSAFANVKAMDAGTYSITWTVSAAGDFADDYNPVATAEGEEVKATIGQYTLYIGGNQLEKTIEEVIDLETNTPLISMADFVKEGAFIGGETDEEKAEILNKLIVPTQTIEQIITNAKLGDNGIGLTAVAVEPAKDKLTNYAVDEAHLLSNGATLTLKAIEAAIQADPAGYTDLKYTGEDQELIETAAVGYKANGGAGAGPAIGKVVYSLEKEGTYTDDLTAIVGKDAAEYEVFYKVELDASEAPENLDKFYEYTAEVKSIKVTIAQADNAITNLALDGWTYGETPNEPVAEALFAAEGEPTFTYSDSETGTFSEEVPTDAGTWYVKASVAETTNWAAAEKTISFEIGKAVAAIATAPAAKELIYNREPQALVEAGVSDDGTVMYSLTGEATDFAEEIPEGTDAGEYNVYYMVKGDANHTDLIVDEPVVVTIAKADVTDIVAPAAINLTYNGYDQALVEAATFEDEFVKGTFEYSIDGENWSADIPVARNAGEYTVQTKFTPNDNHNEAIVEDVTVTINIATIGYSLSNITKDWDGEPFGEEEISKLFTLSAGGDGTKLLGDDEYDKPFTLSLPEDYRDAGTYTFKQPKVEFKEGYPVNYNVTFNGTAEVIINKVDLVENTDYTAPAAVAGLGYIPEALQELVTAGEVTSKNAEDYPNTEIAGKEFGTIMFATAEDGEYKEEIPTGTEAKDYEVWFYVKGDINHNDTKPVKIENTIAPAVLTADFLPGEYKTELPYQAAAYTATDFIPALEGIDEEEGYEVFAPEMKDAGEYTILFQGINNYAGEDSKFEVTVTITPLDVIATAPKGVEKVYDGTASLEGAVTNEEISFSGVLSTDKLTLPEDLALTTEGINVGTYAIKVDAAAINALNKNYNVLEESIDGEVTITKAPAFKVGFDEVPATWTKVFGEADTELTGFTVKAEEGKFFDDIADVLAAATAKRAEGEDVGEYDVTLEFDETAEVFANYEGVEFDGVAATFTITKSDKVYTVSLANVTKTYTGEEFDTAIEFTADDLVIAGYEGDKAKFFDAEGLPTATIAAGAKNAGDYNITLEGGASTNFKFTFVPATFTIAPFEVTEATIEAQKVQKGKELDVTKFTITAPEADADLFYVTAPGLVDMNDIVTGDAGVYADGLVIAVDESVIDNYTGLDKFTAELEIISADAIVLADNDDFTTEDKDNVTVTFASRNLNAGTWNVVALPFAASVAQISEAFGYAAVDVLNETSTDGNIHFNLISSGEVPAYTPFIVKTTEDKDLVKTNFDQVVFYDVNIKAMATAENKYVSDATGNKFWGTFKNTTFYGQQYWYMSKGEWKDARNYTEASPVKLKPFRAYVEFDEANVKAGARIFVEEPDGTVTAIDAVTFNSEINGEGMYNLNGVKVSNTNRKGVYIQNGKKVIKK